MKIRRYFSVMMVAMILFSSIAVLGNEMIISAYAATQVTEPREYEWNFENGKVIVTYSVHNEIVREESVFIENGETLTIIKREINPNGELSVYHDNVLKYCSYTDYDTFLAIVQNGLHNVIPTTNNGHDRTIYQVCGSTLYHELLSTTSETIDTRVSGIADLGASALAQYLLASFTFVQPYAGFMLAAVSIYNIMHSTPCEYIDITEYKYYVYDYSLNQAKNCFHTYLVFYNITNTGARQVVDAQWKCSEVVI